MSAARRETARGARRALGLLLALAALAGLCFLAERLPGAGFDFRPGKNRFQALPRKPFTLGDVLKANLLPVISPVVINEVGLADAAGPLDECGNPDDWVELYNRSDRPVPLAGCTLTDTLGRKRKWPLPDVEIAPRGYLLLWADGESRLHSSVEAIVKENGAWISVRDDFQTRTGFTWYGSNSVPAVEENFLARRLRADFDVTEPGPYCLWLRIRNDGEHPAVLRCAVDGGNAFPVSIRPGRGYQLARIRHPRAEDGFWPFDYREHTISIALEQGQAALARILATHADRPFEMDDPSIHAGFRLSGKGEMVALYSARGVPLDYVAFPALPPGKSFGRVPAGSQNWRVADPTPMGRPLVRAPKLSRPTGYLDGPASLQAEPADPADTVRYTLDGSPPTEHSPVFPESLVITQKCLVRVRSFRPGASPSAVETRMFWPGPRPDMPVMWLAMNPENLWGRQNGIMLNVMARGVSSERPCYAALFEPDGRVTAADIGLRNQGRTARTRALTRSFRISCRARYGHDRWPGAVFDGEGPDRPRSFILRSKVLVHHPLGLEVMRSAGLLAPRTKHALVYMNHEPYGVYFLMEDPEQPEYIEHHYGHLDVDMIKRRSMAHPVIFGTAAEFDRAWARITRGGAGYGNPEAVDRVIEPGYLARWIAATVFLDSGDNDQNYYVFDKRRPAPAWSIVNWDQDGAFYWTLLGQTNTVRNAANVMGFIRQVFSSRMRDPAYDRYYLVEFQRLLNHPFQPTLWLRRIDELEDHFMYHVEQEYEGDLNQNRGGPGWPKVRRLKLADVRREQEEEFAAARRFLAGRADAVRSRLQEEYGLTAPFPVSVQGDGVTELLIDGWPESLPYEGRYFPGTPLALGPVSNRTTMLSVKGAPLAGGTLETSVTEALTITAGRGRSAE